MKEKYKKYIFPLLITLIWVIYFFKNLFSGKYFFLRDVYNLYFPRDFLIHMLISSREIPFFNPFFNCGEPILSNPHYMLFYPFLYPYFLSGNVYFFQLHFLIHILFGSLGFYYLTKNHVKNDFSAFLGSIIYGFSGFSISHVLFQNLVVYIGILPWFLLFLRNLILKNRWIDVILLTISVSLLIFGIEPYYFMMTMVMGFVYLISFKKNIEKKSIYTLLLAVFLTFLLTSIQIIPTLNIINNLSLRRTSITYHASFNYFYNLLIPNIYGDFIKYFFSSVGNGKLPFYISLYIGIIPSFFIFFGYFTLKNKKKLTIFLSLLFLILISSGGILYKFLSLLPFFKVVRYPVKFLFPIFFIFSFLFTKGVDVFFNEKTSLKTGISSICLTLFLFLISYYEVYEIFKKEGATKYFFKHLSVPLYLTPIFLISIFLIKKIKGKPHLSYAILFFLIFFNMTLDKSKNATISEKYFTYKPEYVKLSKKIEHNFYEKYRISPESPENKKAEANSAIDLLIFINEYGTNLLPEIYKIPQGIIVYVSGLGNEVVEKILNKLKNEKEFLNLIHHEGVILIISEKGIKGKNIKPFFTKKILNKNIFYYVVGNVPPIIHFTKKIIFENSSDKIIKHVLKDDFDDRELVYVLEKGKEKTHRNFSTNSNFKILEINNHRVLLKCSVKNGKSFLVFKETYFPGWKVYLDGKIIKNYRVNGIFQGCIVPEGEHRVLFTYTPEGLKPGIFLFISGILIIIGIFIFQFRWEKIE